MTDDDRFSCVTGDKPAPGRTGPKRKKLVDLFQGVCERDLIEQPGDATRKDNKNLVRARSESSSSRRRLDEPVLGNEVRDGC